MALMSLWLRALYPPLGVWAPHDDLHFIHVAATIGSGDWLGPYGQLTLAKGVFYPLFILVNHVTGVPLKMSEHAVYLLASLLAANTVATLTGKRWLLLPSFAVLAFSPIAWKVEFARVLRESIYHSESLTLFFLVALYLARPARGQRPLGIALGVVAGCYWLTREEGIWLLPALTVVSLPWIFAECRNGPEMTLPSRVISSLTGLLRTMLPALVPFALILIAVSALNYHYYGVFRDNDFRSGTPFAQAYGALSRIRHDEWKRYVVFPYDARQRAYAVSPAARELQPYFEGQGGLNWVKVSQSYPPPWGCANAPASCNNEILSGWFVWAVRDAVSTAGYYRSARAADAYYERLAHEINAACEKGAIPCHAPRDTLAPVWRHTYLADSVTASRSVLNTLIQFPIPIGVMDSSLTPETRSIIEFAIDSEVSGDRASDTPLVKPMDKRDAIRRTITESISRLYAMASPKLFSAALLSYVFLFFVWAKSRSAGVSTYAIAILTGLGVAVFSRVGMLGFLEATSLPANNILYLSSAVPFYLLFIVASLCLSAAVAFDWATKRRKGGLDDPAADLAVPQLDSKTK